jgi:predicted nucleotidyltransferase
LLENVNRGFRDRDYLRTHDNLFFTVIGNVHPKDRVLAYLKYLPNPRGKWGRVGERYARSTRFYSAANMMKTVDFLRKRYPQYVYRFKPLQISFSAVPHERITEHFRPEERLGEIRHAKYLDNLERKTIQLASLLSERSGVPIERLGVTGSILINVHTSFSDIDLTVYGRPESGRIKESLLSLYKKGNSQVRRFYGNVLSTWCTEQSSVHRLNRKEARELYSRMWNKAIYRNTIFSIHPVKIETEVTEQFGEESYEPVGVVEMRAKVVDAADSCFLPGTYLVTDVQFESGGQIENVERVVTYEGLYGDLAREGDVIFVRGKLEKVFDASRRVKYSRILVGSPEARASDFIRVAGRRLPARE